MSNLSQFATEKDENKAKMKLLFVCLAAFVAVCSCENKYSPPKVMLYSRDPGEYGQKNCLVCHVTDFYPPNLQISVLKDDVEIQGHNQTDLAFRSNWRFHLTKTVFFTPQKGEQYTCRVAHGDNVNTVLWEPNM